MMTNDKENPTPSAVSAEARDCGNEIFRLGLVGLQRAEAIQRAIDSARAKDRAEIERLESQVQAETNYRFTLKEELEQCITHLESALALESADREADRKELESDYTALKKENARLESELAEAKKFERINEMWANAEALQKEYVDLREKLAAVTKERDSIKSSYIRLRAAVNGSLAIDLEYMDSIQKQLATTTARAERLEVDLKNVNEICEQAKKDRDYWRQIS